MWHKSQAQRLTPCEALTKGRLVALIKLSKSRIRSVSDLAGVDGRVYGIGRVFVFSLIERSALDSACLILFSSSSLSAISLDSYSRTVAQPPTELSAILINLFLSLSLLINPVAMVAEGLPVSRNC